MLLQQAAKEAGAQGAGYVMLRLPWAVSPIFVDWLRAHRPLQAERIEGLIRTVRGGQLYDSAWGTRMRGTGPYAEGIDASFDLFSKKLGLDKPWEELDCSQFAAPRPVSGQLRLF